MENWQSAETQKDIEQLMSAYGDFHDACIVSLNFQSGAFVDDKSAMHFGGPEERVLSAALSVVFLWSVFALFKRLKTRKRLAAAASLLLAVPTCLLINLVLSKLFFLPVIDVWDMLAIFLLLISAAALFIADLAAKKKHIVSEKKPEHSGSRGHA